MLPAAARREPPRRIAILGNAGGTVARAFGHFFPRTAVDAVEIDGELTELGRRYFDLRNPRMEIFAEDARPWLERSDGGYDAIMVDAYRQPYIPFYLTTARVLRAGRSERLAPGGVTIVNVGHPEDSDELERVLGRDDGDRLPARAALPDRGRPTRCWSAATADSPRERLRRNLASRCRRTCGRWRWRPPRRWSRACRAARSTPTTTPRSSGWSTSSLLEYAE